ncbi:MAG: hypothetical protein AB1344_00760 [Pseudomonadota bacterium]
MRLLRPLVPVAFLAASLTGCMATESPAPTVREVVGIPSSQQVMLRYHDGRAEQAARADLARLSGIAGLVLEYVRPMSGQAHVMRFPSGTSAQEVEQAMQRLRTDPAIQYIESDRGVTRQ